MAAQERFRVLVVDDDPEVLLTSQMILSDVFDVEVASSGDEALKILEAHDFHVVCADFRMPGMDGMELLTRVMQGPQVVSGLLVTGHVEALGRSEWDHSRNLGIMLKPYQSTRLIETIEQFARLTQMRRSMEPTRIAAGPVPTGGESD